MFIVHTAFALTSILSFFIIKTPTDPAIQPVTGFDMEKVMTTLKQFVRDWSDEVLTWFLV